jgi:PPM family protein phosphatase
VILAANDSCVANQPQEPRRICGLNGGGDADREHSGARDPRPPGLDGVAVMPRTIQLSVHGRSDIGLERTNNEDALVVADALTGNTASCLGNSTFDVSGHPVLLAVADGMGGENAGEVASGLTLASLRYALSKELARCEPAEALRAAIEHAHAVVTGSANVPGREGMGATVVAAVVHEDRAYVGAVGDSRVYVLRQHQLVQVTKDQSFLQYLIDAGSITEGKIATFPHKNVILQAIGRAPDLSFSILKIALRRDDVLLLCTDGLTGEVDDDVIRDLVATAPIDLACAKLIEAANARGGRDNITVILASVDGEGVSSPRPGEGVSPELVTSSRPPRAGTS